MSSGVHQRDVLEPILFIILVHRLLLYIFKNSTSGTLIIVVILSINYLHFADDVALLESCLPVPRKTQLTKTEAAVKKSRFCYSASDDKVYEVI